MELVQNPAGQLTVWEGVQMRDSDLFSEKRIQHAMKFPTFAMQAGLITLVSGRSPAVWRWQPSAVVISMFRGDGS